MPRKVSIAWLLSAWLFSAPCLAGAVPAATDTENSVSSGSPVLPGYAYTHTKTSRITAGLKHRFDWYRQTEGVAESMSRSTKVDRELLRFVSRSFKNMFDGWMPVILSIKDEKAIPRARGIFLPDISRLYYQEDFFDTVIFEEDVQEERFNALQFPIPGELGVLNLRGMSWTSASEIVSPREVLKKDILTGTAGEESGTYIWVGGRLTRSDREKRDGAPEGERGSSRWAGILLIAREWVMDLEGGDPHLAIAPQLLVYDETDRLILVAGFGQVTVLNWENRRGGAVIAGGRSVNGFGFPTTVLRAVSPR